MSRAKKESQQVGLLGVDAREQSNRNAVHFDAETVGKAVFRIKVAPFTETHLVSSDHAPICNHGQSWEHAGKDDKFTAVCAACMAEASRLGLRIA
jgi:hypothetical protein